MKNKGGTDKLEKFIASEKNKLENYIRKKLYNVSMYDIEDIIQDTIYNLLNKPNFDIYINNLAAYFYKSISNRITDSIRKNKNDLSMDKIQEDCGDINFYKSNLDVKGNPEEALEKKEIRKILIKAINNLDDKDKEIIMQLEVNEYSYKELSVLTKQSITTLRTRKFRAMKRLKKELESLGLYGYDERI